ncbi:MAG: T9SS type A sorting domain-containing protein [Bacteroidia bacterium]
MRNLMILAVLFVLAPGQLRSQITTYHDTLPAGMYLVRVFTGEQMRTFKLVIVR